MKIVTHNHVIQKDKDLDKSLALWLKDLKQDIIDLPGERVHIKTNIREAKDGDIKISSIIGFK